MPQPRASRQVQHVEIRARPHPRAEGEAEQVGLQRAGAVAVDGVSLPEIQVWPERAGGSHQDHRFEAILGPGMR